jgi:hypothetical protein
MDPRKALIWGVSAIALIACLMMFNKMFENVNADEIVCIQSPLKGTLNWYKTPGVKWQGFGKVTRYLKLSTYEFQVPVRFNDGGHGTMVGSLNYELPLDDAKLTQLHIKYGSQEAIQKQLVETVTDKCVYMTGPLMSSKESYAEKRTSLIHYVEDQIINGVYKTTQREVKVKDPMTGQDKTATIVEIVVTKQGFERQEEPVLLNYGIRVTNFAVKGLPYDEDVEKQIKSQQELIMKVQTAIASAKEAEQRAITAAKEGEAGAAKAKWDQEIIKAQKVTEAQQQLEVAQLTAKAAEANKRANILKGEGEGAYKRLVMQANGALDQKLDAYIKVNEFYAKAFENYKGDIVPKVVMGGGNGKNGSNGAMDLISMLNAKTAQDLGISFDVKGADNTK